jgi:Rrf2 family protein
MAGITRNTDYAARLVIHLACLAPGTVVAIGEIARHRLLPVPFVRRLVARLVRGGILASVRGAAGGVRLARPAAEISLLDLVNIMEGGITLNDCVDNPKSCPLGVRCPVQEAWAEATQLLEGHLASIRFDALATGRAGHVDAHGPRAVPAAVRSRRKARHSR